ncbi:indole-3-acetic acid-amido synthetase GH3.5-like isoform X1 [Cucumis melo]|uniref:Indole-3-acetic acid-amido synthetase GH3.5-like isoform X1 n=1 Tax=Cucumis melo TaxID=3656 RepID=A0A1S3B3T7_CUCME|nr:indole-3-acetic acid-amido synthetase GH3.5-like isoform X1 [Cucumis melo]
MSSNVEHKWLLDEKDYEALQQIQDITSNADEIQPLILTEILSTNANVEYLQQHGLDGSTDSSTFKKLIPLVSYEQLQPYITRIAEGDDSPILCSNPITGFFVSSGTSGGEPKLVPIYEQEFERRLSFFNYLMARTKQLFPNINCYNDKAMNFHFAKPDHKTKAGILVSSVFTRLLKTSLNLKSIATGNNAIPDDILLCTDTYQSLYCQLLCGLYQNDLVFQVGSIFASGLLHVFKFLENHWADLVSDIRTGSINNPKITDLSLRESVMKILVKPNPQLADLIETECSKGTWKGIVRRLWPNTKYIKAIATGSLSQYIPLLNYYTNNLPIFSDHYGSTECLLGLNLDPICDPNETSYTLIPTMAYFEFLPMDTTNINGEVTQELVDLVDVKLGQEYELVITTFAGLYRYCIGDILRVTGFTNKAPKFSFVRRKNVILNLEYEKTNESDLRLGVEKAGGVLKPFGATIVDYTSYADTSTIPGHYVLYWELLIDGNDHNTQTNHFIPSSVYNDCCLAIEDSLSTFYRIKRSQEKTINPLEIRVVKSGTFEKLMQLAINGGASMNQYKTPRSLNSNQIHFIQLLESNVISSYFSQKNPRVGLH